MKYIPLALVIAFSLAGCDAVKDLGAQVAKLAPEHDPMTLVFHSGYKMIVDGRAAPIFGKDECPPATEQMEDIFGPALDEGQRSCVVIAPDTKSVSVTVGLPEGPSAETWAVERSGDQIMLRRADGTLLREAQHVHQPHALELPQ